MELEKRMEGVLWRQQWPKVKTIRCDEERRNGRGLEGDWETKGHDYKMGDTREYFWDNGNNVAEKEKIMEEREGGEIFERWEGWGPELDLVDVTWGLSWLLLFSPYLWEGSSARVEWWERGKDSVGGLKRSESLCQNHWLFIKYLLYPPQHPTQS